MAKDTADRVEEEEDRMVSGDLSVALTCQITVVGSGTGPEGAALAVMKIWRGKLGPAEIAPS